MNAIIRGPIPPTPTHEQRLREFRAKVDPQVGNFYPWPHLQREFERLFGEAYSRAETLDGAMPTTDTYF